MTMRFARRLCFIIAGMLTFGLVFREAMFYHDFSPQTRTVLEGSTSTTVFGLDPRPEYQELCAKQGDACFHGYRITSTVTQTEPVASEIYRAWKPITMPALCFMPHHGVRVTRDGHTADFVLCFHCSAGNQWFDGVKQTSFAMAGSSEYFDTILGSHRPSSTP